MPRLLADSFCPPRCPVQGLTPARARPLVPNRIYRPKRKIHAESAPLWQQPPGTARVTRQPDDISGPDVPAGPGAKPLAWRLADAGSVRVRFPHRRQPPADRPGASGPGRLPWRTEPGAARPGLWSGPQQSRPAARWSAARVGSSGHRASGATVPRPSGRVPQRRHWAGSALSADLAKIMADEIIATGTGTRARTSAPQTLPVPLVAAYRSRR